MREPFRNEPFTDFTQDQQRAAMADAINKVRHNLGQTYALRIGGERITTENIIPSISPANPQQVVGMVSQANTDLAEKAMQTAVATFQRWKEVAPLERARYLFKAAAILRRRKHEFSAWMIFEAGKTWSEADGDTAEAIDFMEFYGREMERLSERQPLTHLYGEDNELYYLPLGVGVVIAPWNFPLAIMVGMTTASIVAGNTVVLKPASTTAVIASRFMDILEEAGLPPGVVNYLPGPGGEIGDYLVDHPLTRYISFTGSREVGLRINERAARTGPGHKWIKRLIAEMGGKNSIIVDKDCDLDLASEAITLSAFGFSGQKCSACSRAIIHEEVYDEVLKRVVEHTSRLKMGDPADIDSDMGPVIDDKAYRKILEYIEIGKKEGRLVYGGGMGETGDMSGASHGKTGILAGQSVSYNGSGGAEGEIGGGAAGVQVGAAGAQTGAVGTQAGIAVKQARENGGFFIQPTIFADVDSHARIAQEEIFGPVLTFIKAKNFDEALEFANNTEYGLTGAVISRNRVHLEKARREFYVGNLYFNRKGTGALVGVHPFGGFNMSGTDSKAGGRDYLLLFTQGKLVSERL